MSISRRVTARYNRRKRMGVLKPDASPSYNRREEPDAFRDDQEECRVANLPVAEFRSDPTPTSPAPTHSAPTVDDRRSMSLCRTLRDARARAEEILWQHPRHEVPGGSTSCQLCLVAYPCDAIRAAEDVIAISARLHLGESLSGSALLELMNELVDLGAVDANGSPKPAPAARAAYGYGPATH